MKAIFYAQARGGSTILFNILRSCLNSTIQVSDFEGTKYEQGEIKKPRFRTLYPGLFNDHIMSFSSHTLFGPCRELSLNMLPECLYSKDIVKLLITRDPMETITSMYFARKLHDPAKFGEKITDVTIDKYCIAKSNETSVINDELRGAMAILRLDNTIHTRYEDIIISPERWLKTLADKLPGFISRDAIYQSLLQACFVQITTDINQFHRDGMPGNYKTLLNPRTIEAMNNNPIIREFRNTFHYPVDVFDTSAVSTEAYLLTISTIRAQLHALTTQNQMQDERISKLEQQLHNLSTKRENIA